MAMITCPECEKSVSSQADMCPNCGFGIKKWFEINFEICPVCNTIIKKEKDKKAFCPKCRRNLSDLRLEFYGKMAHEAVIKVSAKEREEAISTGRLKEFPWKDKIVPIYTNTLDDYKVYNKAKIFIEKIMKLQEELQNETKTDINMFINRYEDKNNGPKTIYDCCDTIIKFFGEICTKRCQDIANKINEAVSNKNFIKGTDVVNCYLDGYKLQTKEFVDELSSVDYQVKQKLEINKTYRDIKKTNRGSFIGGGSSVKGALKGMLVAGVANATYGGLYGFKNSLENAREKDFANAKITKYLHQADFINTLCRVLKNDLNSFIPLTADFAIYVLKEYFGINTGDFDYLNEEYNDLDKKIESRLKGNDIEAFKQCLQDYPFYLPVYERILRQFGDEDNELEAIGKFCGVNIQPIKRNLLNDKTIPSKKGLTNFEYKLYLGLQETTNEFIKIKEIVSKIDQNNPKSIISAIKELKVLNSPEAKTAIKDYIKKIVTWSNGKEPADILSVIEELKALNSPEAEDTIKKCMDRIVTWINGRSPADILSVIEELKALNSPEAEDTIKKCMDRIVTWADEKSPADILSVIEELKALNNPETEDTIKKCMDKILTWADEKSPADILSTIEDLKTIDSPEAEDIIKEYKRKNEEKLKIKEVVSKSKIDGNSPKNLVLAIEQLKAVNTKDEIEKYEMIQRCEDLIITWIDGKSLERILSAIEDLASLDIPKAKDVIKEYMDKIVRIDEKSPEDVLSTLENFKTIDIPEVRDIIKKYKEAVKIKCIVNRTDKNNPESMVSAIEDLKTIDSQEAKDITKEYMDRIITWADKKSSEDILLAIEDLKTIDSQEAKDIIKKYKEVYNQAQYSKAVKLFNGAKNVEIVKQAIEILKKIPDYKDSQLFIDRFDEKCEEINKNLLYEQLNENIATFSSDDYNAMIMFFTDAAESFNSISGWLDADEQAENCLKIVGDLEEKLQQERIKQERIKQERIQQEKIKQEQEQKKKKKMQRLGIAIFAVIIALSVLNVIQINKTHNKTVAYINSKYFSNGKLILHKLGNYKHSMQLATGDNHTVGLKSDGTVVAAGDNLDGQCNVKKWSDIVTVAAGDSHTVGLKSDGTVVAAGFNWHSQCNVKKWSDIVAVAAGDFHTVGLKSDGTVVATGENANSQCNVKKWSNIVTITAGGQHHRRELNEKVHKNKALRAFNKKIYRK